MKTINLRKLIIFIFIININHGCRKIANSSTGGLQDRSDIKDGNEFTKAMAEKLTNKGSLSIIEYDQKGVEVTEPIFNNAKGCSFHLFFDFKFQIKIPGAKAFGYCKKCNNYHPQNQGELCNKDWVIGVKLYFNGNQICKDKVFKLKFLKKVTSVQPTPSSQEDPCPNEPIPYTPNYPIRVKAPVIYFYNEKEIEYSIKFNMKKNQKLTFSDPNYTPDSGWKFVSKPDGRLVFNKEREESHYPYLYYTFDTPKSSIPSKWKLSGFIVKKGKVIQFLREKLSFLGLNYREKGDFILYWAEKLLKHEAVYIHFLVDKEVNELLPMTTYSNVDLSSIKERRIFMIYSPCSKDKSIPTQDLTLYPKINRELDKNLIIEWGGLKLDL